MRSVWRNVRVETALDDIPAPGQHTSNCLSNSNDSRPLAKNKFGIVVAPLSSDAESSPVLLAIDVVVVVCDILRRRFDCSFSNDCALRFVLLSPMHAQNDNHFVRYKTAFKYRDT
jgi:hypothetical protein